ncbi:hypothetical protein H6P81_007652 [Aristolochia fimbriata]|uniref:Uncharacterized protein n=1 Tax=Aristolochia fimbriata TaxID=158543 RepID=A0AAV7F129_ARIFI|nr:hypothetical protein H6P81_007652 [Aristolochia fimbriata]
MERCYLNFFICVIPVITQMILSCSISGFSWCQPDMQERPKFKQKTDRFWEFDEESKNWVELKLPFELKSCINDNCTIVGSILPLEDREKCAENENDSKSHDEATAVADNSGAVLSLRRRISLTKMTEGSVWITGESGSIYERFWNGIQWVIAPHDLPVSVGSAVSVFIINQTILTLSEAGILYQLQLDENSQPVWTDFMPIFGSNMRGADTESNSTVQVKSGAVSRDGEVWGFQSNILLSLCVAVKFFPILCVMKKAYFTTMNGLLLELCQTQGPRWASHGRPPGGDVAAIADAANFRQDVVFTVSSSGDLYEFDKSSKPSWKKHIRGETLAEEISFLPSPGCALHGLFGSNSLSLFLLTKSGDLVERRLHQRKWKWIIHEAPEGQNLTAITPSDLNDKGFSLFFTTATGSVLEYQLHKHLGSTNLNRITESWVNHNHPPHAKVARGILGLQLQTGRMVFPLDDGRISELHFAGLGGDTWGPSPKISSKRKTLLKYEWSILDAPQTEGWNAEYCSIERGPTNCFLGMGDTLGHDESTLRRRKGSIFNNYLLPSIHRDDLTVTSQQNNFPRHGINTNFRMRTMQTKRSFFLVTDSGITFEYLYIENVWIWLRHDHSTSMKGVLGTYNGSLFLVDKDGNLLIRERNNDELSWINCTAMRKGKQVASGPPWDGIPGRAPVVTTEDALFFITRSGRLLQFTVSLRKFKWKDCRSPPNIRIASIVDQEMFRSNIVFVIGGNGRLYQYNKLTELWHEHSQSPHLVISRLPGTAMRPSSESLTGSLFMFTEYGGLIEYSWNAYDGWKWIEHGTPNRNVTLVGAPGPCFEGYQLFIIGSDGNVYLRFFEQRMWKWQNYGFPSTEQTKAGAKFEGRHRTSQECLKEDVISNGQKQEESMNDLKKNCDEKVAPIRPIPFSDDSVIFELRDGRLAELRRTEDLLWVWARTIGTPTSLCVESYWTALAS